MGLSHPVADMGVLPGPCRLESPGGGHGGACPCRLETPGCRHGVATHVLVGLSHPVADVGVLHVSI